jgi:hypothetical protein
MVFHHREIQPMCHIIMLQIFLVSGNTGIEATIYFSMLLVTKFYRKRQEIQMPG